MKGKRKQIFADNLFTRVHVKYFYFLSFSSELCTVHVYVDRLVFRDIKSLALGHCHSSWATH